MIQDGTLPAMESTQLIAALFALIPIPVAVADENGHIVLANSSFTEVFQNFTSLPDMLQREITVPEHGTFDVQTLPLNDHGFKIIYAKDVSVESRFRQEVHHLEKLAAIGRFVTGIAHELRNPLADVLDYVPLIERCEMDDTARSIVDGVFANAARAEHLVQNLLILAGVTETQRVPFDLNEIVRNVIVQLRGRNANLGPDIALDLDRNLPGTVGSPSQIEQVITSLLIHAENAVADSHQEGGFIQVQTGVRAGRVQLQVMDNGQSRETSRIFASGITGISMNICAEIAKDHGGELYAWSARGTGSTFTLELPVFNQDAEGGSGLAGAGGLLRTKSVLVINDEIRISELVGDVLRRLGATVQISSSVSDAYERLFSKEYDLIVCNQWMPGLSGESLYQVMKIVEPARTSRFLFMTGDVITAEARQFFAQPGVRYLRKPFRIQDLVHAVERSFNPTLPGF